MRNNGINGISAVPGCRFHPHPTQLKDLTLPQQIPGPGNSICHRGDQKKKEKKIHVGDNWGNSNSNLN